MNILIKLDMFTFHVTNIIKNYIHYILSIESQWQLYHLDGVTFSPL